MASCCPSRWLAVFLEASGLGREKGSPEKKMVRMWPAADKVCLVHNEWISSALTKQEA